LLQNLKSLQKRDFLFYNKININKLFPFWEISIFEKISMKPNFQIELLPEAIEFLEELDDKTREKIYYNIRKSQFINDNELFKKLNNLIWEF
jgi:hypothetical protein